MAKPKRYTEAEKSKVVNSGLTGPKAAKKFGISENTFYTWKREAKKQAKGKRGTVKRAGRKYPTNGSEVPSFTVPVTVQVSMDPQVFQERLMTAVRQAVRGS